MIRCLIFKVFLFYFYFVFKVRFQIFANIQYYIPLHLINKDRSIFSMGSVNEFFTFFTKLGYTSYHYQNKISIANVVFRPFYLLLLRCLATFARDNKCGLFLRCSVGYELIFWSSYFYSTEVYVFILLLGVRYLSQSVILADVQEQSNYKAL